MEKGNNYIDECLEEFGNIINQHNKIDINRISYSLCEDIETFLKQKLQEVEQKKVEEIIDDIEKIKNAVRVSTGSFKYDSCYNDVLNLKSLTKE